MIVCLKATNVYVYSVQNKALRELIDDNGNPVSHTHPGCEEQNTHQKATSQNLLHFLTNRARS
ncbi:protein of unknown function [Methylocaldum szegediense]|uniref:Transposase n=1 Tax=Methylocaldum szegediense TaxID=73780 RepID=A0ABM9HXI3_9GAMM|nr:protein of unknown function [Methylocaldum szegediense]